MPLILDRQSVRTQTVQHSIAMDAPARRSTEAPHHTKADRLSARGGARGVVDEQRARELLADELEEHFDKCYSLRVQIRRHGRRWEDLERVEVLHPGDGDEADLTQQARDTLPQKAERIDKYVAEVFDLVDGASLDGPLAARVYGCAERPTRHLFEVPAWVAGEVLAFGPAHEESMVASVATMARVVDQLAKSVERTLNRADRVADRNESQAQQLFDLARGASAELMKFAIETSSHVREAALPSVELKRIELEQKQAELRHAEQLEQSRLDANLIEHAIDAALDAYTGGSVKKGGDPSHCDEARTLAGVLELLNAEGKDKMKDLLSDDEHSAILRAAQCATTAEFDAAYGVFYRSLVARGKDEATRIYSAFGPLVGPGVFKLHRLNSGYEERAGL